MAAAPVLGRGLRLLRPHRARHRVGRGRAAHAGREDRRGLADLGQKMWISLGNVAEVALIFAQTDPAKAHRGIACFLVPTATDGFSTQEIHGKLGLRSSDTAALSLDGVEVGDDALMGEVGDGFKVAMSALDSGRYSVAAGCVGICQGCVRRLGRLRDRAQAVRRPDRELPARAGDDRRHHRPPRRRAGAGPAGRRAQGRRANPRPSRPRSPSSTRASRRSSAPTSRSRSTAARATSTTTRSSATCATRG